MTILCLCPFPSLLLYSSACCCSASERRREAQEGGKERERSTRTAAGAANCCPSLSVTIAPSKKKTGGRQKKANTPSKAKPATASKRKGKSKAGDDSICIGDDDTMVGFGRKASKQSSAKGVASMFSKYEGSVPNFMEMEGIAELGTDLGLDPSTDVALLVLCWKLGAKSPGRISREEFVAGMESLSADSMETLKALLPSFDPGFMEQADFKEFYRFTFQFSREGTHRTIEKALIIELLPLVISNRSKHVTKFVEFLEKAATDEVITFDQWNSFLEFSSAVEPSLEGYDESAAWPVLLDEYVEYVKQGDSKPPAK